MGFRNQKEYLKACLYVDATSENLVARSLENTFLDRASRVLKHLKKIFLCL